MPARCGIVQQASAGLGRHCFASDDWFQPVLLCGLFAAPSGFHKILSFKQLDRRRPRLKEATKKRRQPLHSLRCNVGFASLMPFDSPGSSGAFAERIWESAEGMRRATARFCASPCGSFPSLPPAHTHESSGRSCSLRNGCKAAIKSRALNGLLTYPWAPATIAASRSR